MVLHRSSSSEPRACRVPLEALLGVGTGGREEEGVLLVLMRDQESGARWCRAAPRSLPTTGKGAHHVCHTSHPVCRGFESCRERDTDRSGGAYPHRAAV